MIIKDLIVEDFSNYKKTSLVVCFPYCTFKCENEGLATHCQNKDTYCSKNIEVSSDKILSYYKNNPYTHAIVCSGLEPLDSFDDVYELLKKFREISNDDFVIYTGYNESEVYDKISKITEFDNIIIKFGRMDDSKIDKHYDDILGVTLISSNQYAKLFKKET